MAKKIIISFLNNPTVGEKFAYNFYVASLPIIYQSGATIVDITYTNILADVSANKVLIKPSLTETINDTLIALSTYYLNFSVVYTKVNNTIEIIFSQDDSIVDNTIPTTNISISSLNVFNADLKLRYFLEYLDPMNVPYRIDIFRKGYELNAEQIQGYGILQAGSVKNNLETIRGSALTLNLEATDQLNLSDLYTDDENQFTVRFYRNSMLLFDGFIKPDGVFQSFVKDRWEMSIDCVDGLGILKDLAFVKGSGLPWVGKLNGLEIITRCLQRSNLQMNINTSINIYYEGLTPSDMLDPLTKFYLSADRFIKTDNDTIMNCSEVLESVLNLFNAVITQKNGEWYIYRPSEIAYPIVTFRRYTYDGIYTNLNTVNLGKVLGSQINNRYPHHCNANQKIEVKGSVSAFRVNYKYGFAIPKVPNYNFQHTGFDYPNWTIQKPTAIINDPLVLNGVNIKGVDFNIDYGDRVMTSSSVFFTSQSKLSFSVKYNINTTDYATIYLELKLVSVGNPDKYLKFRTDNNADASWENYDAVEENNNSIILVKFLKGEGVFNLENTIVPFDGDITISIFQPRMSTFPNAKNVIFDEVSLNTSIPVQIGEFHTVQRKNRPSSIARETKEIFNGDSPSVIYAGAIFKEDKITPTNKWFRRNIVESKPVLQIMAEDTLRMSQKPAKQFSGDIYGFIPYLSVIKIDSIDGNFMFVEYAFDSKKNILQAKLLEIFNNELPDIDYSLTYDYGSTVKPTITS